MQTQQSPSVEDLSKHPVVSRKQWLEARSELLIAVGGQGAECQPVEAVLGGEHALAPRRGTPELDRRLDRFRARAREQAPFDPAAGECDQLFGKQAG